MERKGLGRWRLNGKERAGWTNGGETSPPAALSPACLGHRMISNHGWILMCSYKLFLAVFSWLKPFWHNLHLPLSLFLCFSASQVKFCFIFLQIPGKANLTETITIYLVATWKRWEIIIFFPSMMGKNWKKVINRRSSKKQHRPVTIHLPCEIPILSKTTPKMIGFTNFKMNNFDLWYFWIRGVK